KMYAASHAQTSVLVESGIEIRNSLRAHIAPLSRPASSNDMGISISPASDNLVVTAQYCAVYPRINRAGVAYMNHVLGVFQRRTSPIDSTFPGIAKSASVRKLRIGCSRRRDIITCASRNSTVIR